MRFDRKTRVKINSKVFDSNNWKNRIAICRGENWERNGWGWRKKSVIYFKPVKFEMLFNIEEEISRRQLYL